MGGILGSLKPTRPTLEQPELRSASNSRQDNVESQTPAVRDRDSDSDNEVIHKEMQAGIQKVEATAQVWNRYALYSAYGLVWMLYAIDAIEGGTQGLLAPYVTSEFQAHSLTAATSIMASLISGIFRLPLAKIMDIWGRPQGFALMVLSMTLGQIMMAASQNVQTYAAAEVFNQLGGVGRQYVMSILIADTSSLKNRGFMFAFISSPFIFSVWCTGPLSQAFLNGPGWRWAFGAFAIIHPITSAPLYILMQYNYNKAVKQGLMPVRNTGRKLTQSIKHYVVEFDLFGLFLLCAGLALFLLPFSLYSYQIRGWQSAMVIAMIIIGGLLLIGFGIWEAKFAPKQCMPWHLLKDRTILGANVLAAVLFVEFYIWNSYFSSFLQVVPGLSVVQTGYVLNIYSIGSCFWALICGIVMSRTGDFKKQSLAFGLPLTILGVGLMIYFRQPEVNVGYIIMCQIFIAFGGGTLVIAEQVAAMAATTHQYVAIVLGIEGMFSSVGGAIGSTLAAAIWTGTYLDNLHRFLPGDAQGEAAAIYASLPTQLTYAAGTPIRDAISAAYGESQRIMCAAATGILALAVVAVLMWRDLDVRRRKQVKGLVF